MPDQNFIDNEWRPARSSGATDDILNPATGAVIGTAPGQRGGRRRRRRARPRPAPSRSGPPRRRASAARRSTSWPRRIEADIDNLSAIESENVGKPVSIMEFEMDLTLDNWRFFAVGRPLPRGPRRGRVHGGLHLDAAPRAARRDRLDRAVELPAQHGDLEGRPRRWRSATPSCSSRRSSRRTPRCGSPSWPPTSCRRACSTSCAARARPRASALVDHPDVAMVSLTGSRRRPARPSPRRRRTRSSACTSSSAARRRSSCSTTPTSAAVAAGVARGRLLQLRARTAPPPAA